MTLGGGQFAHRFQSKRERLNRTDNHLLVARQGFDQLRAFTALAALNRGDHTRRAFEAINRLLKLTVNHVAASSGYRTELAGWLTQPDTPAAALTARVFVNRLWQHYFERGIVSTSGNLGRSGAKPTHPELLNWLAAELMDGSWRIKPIQRLILTSTAYRQSSISDFNPQSEIDRSGQLFALANAIAPPGR